MQKITLNNGLSAVVKVNKDTPRIALNLYLTITNPEEKAGTYTLLNRLFAQGTLKRTSEELAQELEENAIELYSEMKHDFIRFKILCLNEDFDHALEILEDVLFNSQLSTFDKEVTKLRGEITAELDSPRTKAIDNFYKTIYANHFYGNTYTKTLESLDSITIDDVRAAYKSILETSKKNICVVGDIDIDKTKQLLEKHLANIVVNDLEAKELPVPTLTEDKVVTIAKEDANQAQIIQGWIFPSFHSEDYPAISLLNTMLGSCGLSARLFLELREKQGLAYVVRSSYDTYKLSACLSVYIATEPKNIKTCLEGFKKEIDKIQDVMVSDEELENAKNNLIGKRQFFTETNAMQSSLIGLYESEDLGYEYEEQLRKALKAVTKEQIQQVAKKYFSTPKVLSILAPKQYLSMAENVVL